MAKNKKKYYLWVLGCQMNKADSEKVAAVLDGCGCDRVAGENQADIIVVVACSVRQSALDRIYGKAQQWQKRRVRGGLTAVLTGCVLKPDKKKFTSLFDAIIDIKDIGRLPDLLQSDRTKNFSVSDYFFLVPHYTSAFQAYVPIMTGCDNFCAYCVVPYVRGREVSRPARELIKECENLIKKGYKEITLIGQNVNSYSAAGFGFPRLLKKIDDLPGDYWLRFATSHPKDLSAALLDAMANGKHLTPYLHLPIQAGDAAVLKAMNRHYTPSDYLRLVSSARKKMPGIMISTDIIVGFPCESKKQFNNTAKLMRQAQFDMAYIARYSPRAGTAAARLRDNVPREEKKRRERALTEILKRTALKNNKRLINKTVKVLVDGCKNGKGTGKTETFKTVAFSGADSLIGHFVAVRITDASSWGLTGELV